MTTCTRCGCDVKDFWKVSVAPEQKLCKYCYRTCHIQTAESQAMSVMFNLLEKSLIKKIEGQNNV